MAFDIDVELMRGGRVIGAKFATDAGITVLFGRSGVGKSSLLDMVAGLLTPDRGHIRIGDRTLFGPGVNLPPERRRIGYIFQDVRLFPHRRVAANLRYGEQLASPETRWIGFDEVVSFLGLGDILDRWPRTLSGGEAQRVAIGRALLSAPQSLLMDEPLSALDPARRAEILTVIERIDGELGLPILYVTHDPIEAQRLAARQISID